MFVFEGNGVILNLRDAADDKKKYPKILSLAVLTVVTLYMIFSTICFLDYRVNISTYITSNMVPINGFVVVCIVLFSINALSSYPIQILCCFEIIEEAKFFNNTEDTRFKKNLKIYTERIIVIILVTVVSSSIPNFIAFLNLAGSIGSSVLAFILPPIYYIQINGGFKKENKLPFYVFAINVFICLFGIGGGAYSTY